MNWLQRWKDQSARNRDISRLWGEIHGLYDELVDIRRERDIWQTLAIDAQLEAEQFKNIVRDLKS